mmetsp:Transcript_18266/g.27130  ORF Transcript_18266/g.27130 Transcript_18266/m.27130 type:complete len:94 (+) Transcript_18266:329-610(+)
MACVIMMLFKQGAVRKHCCSSIMTMLALEYNATSIVLDGAVSLSLCVVCLGYFAMFSHIYDAVAFNCSIALPSASICESSSSTASEIINATLH